MHQTFVRPILIQNGFGFLGISVTKQLTKDPDVISLEQKQGKKIQHKTALKC